MGYQRARDPNASNYNKSHPTVGVAFFAPQIPWAIEFLT